MYGKSIGMARARKYRKVWSKVDRNMFLQISFLIEEAMIITVSKSGAATVVTGLWSIEVNVATVVAVAVAPEW